MYATLHNPMLRPEIRKYGEAAIHICIWLFFYSEKWTNNWYHLEWNTKIMLTLASLGLPAIFYLNAFGLVPAFLRKGKILQYSLYVVFFILLLEFYSSFLLASISFSSSAEGIFTGEILKWFFKNAPISRTILGFLLSLAYRFTKDWMQNERVKEQLIAEKSTAELAYLKSQVNPHFLFNTLNNLYAVALEEKGERTAEGIARLGSLMRYSLHDSQADYILLSREIDYIERYIELQRLRIPEEKSENILFRTEGEFRMEKIAPMLLLPFIENAFKYGIAITQAPSIKVEMKLAGGVLDFCVTNLISVNTSQKESTGLGIANVKNRLDLLYKNKHSLSCKKEENTYQVKLKLHLQK